jgi:hypothetical protein
MVLSARESGTPPSVLARGDAEEPGEDVIDELARR